MAARRRKTAVDAPTSIEEATALAADYVSAERRALAVRLGAQRVIDATAAARDEELTAISAVQNDRFLRLKAWWEAAGRELAGDRRSAELAGARIGIRLAPPKVKLPRGLTAAGVVAWLQSLTWARAKQFLRVKVELDKQAIIREHQRSESVRRVFAAEGIGVVQEDEFFIDSGLDEEAIRTEIEARR